MTTVATIAGTGKIAVAVKESSAGKMPFPVGTLARLRIGKLVADIDNAPSRIV